MATTCEEIKCVYFKDGKCTDDYSQFEQRCRYNSPEEQQNENETTRMLKWTTYRATAERNGMLIKILRAKDTYDLGVHRREGLIKFIGDFPSLEAAQQKAEEVLKELEG